MESGGLLAPDFPDLEFTAADQEAHCANTRLAEEFLLLIEGKLAELGITDFWNTPGSTHAQSQRQLLLKLPALARCRCLQAMQARLDAVEIPEGLKHRCMDPAGAHVEANAFRRAAVQLSEEMQLATWRSLALRLFAVADPCTYVAALAVQNGQQASLQLPNTVTNTMQELPLTQWPSWYEKQFDALVVNPTAKHSMLQTDENNPARVWREGRAKAKGFDLYPQGVPGALAPRPKRTKRVGIPAGLESWQGTPWKPTSNMIYPPPASADVQPQRRPVLGLAIFAEANPEEPQTLPSLVVERQLAGDYNYLPLAKRVDLDRLYGRMRCSPEWSQVSCKGDRGTEYKVDPWQHMTPYRIQALFKWGIAFPDLTPQPVVPEIPVIIGITDNWEAGEKVSSSGAKVYVQVAHMGTKCRDVVLARVAGLLPEEDMDRCPWLRVSHGEKGAGIVAAPLEPWGMEETPASLQQQRKKGFDSVGLVHGWDSRDVSEQVKVLQLAFDQFDVVKSPAGSWLRAAVFRECARVAKSMAASSTSVAGIVSSQHSSGDPGLALIEAMKQAMSIPPKDLGDDAGSLAPSSVAQLALQSGEASVDGKDTINEMLKTVGQSSQKGLPPQAKPEPKPEPDAGVDSKPPDEGADESSDACKPSGSKLEDEDEARSESSEKSMDPDYGDGVGDEGGGDKDAGAEDKAKDPPQPRPLPFNSPYTCAREFGIVEKTATFMGLPDLVDAELLVPALRLDLEDATLDEVESLMVTSFLELEKKLGASMETDMLFKLQQAVSMIRMQLLAAQKRRVEVCRFIRNNADPGDPRHTCGEPDMKLTEAEVKFWMRQARESLEAEEKQVARRAHDKYVLKCSHRQVEQRQSSRFNGFLKYYFGGSQCLQSYLKDRTFGPRVLPALREDLGKKPDEQVVLYSNKKSARVAGAARVRYFEGLARDLADPTSDKAKQRKTLRFTGLLQRMEHARQGRVYFHDPAPQDKGKDKGKGKGPSIQERWTGQLVSAGLDVGAFTDRRQPQGSPWHQQQQQQQQQQQNWGRWQNRAWWQ